MTDNSILSTVKAEDSATIIPIKHYLHTIESKIIANIENYTLSSEKRISKIEKTLSDLTINYSDIQSKLNDNKVKCLKIDEIFQSNQKIKDQLTSQDNKLTKHTKDVSDSLNKLNQILNDHLTIPGLVGSYCKFKSIREYINHNNQQINNLIISKNKIMNEIEKIQKKMQETLSKGSSHYGKRSHNHSSYFNSSFSELKNSFDESAKEANEKHYSISIDKNNKNGGEGGGSYPNGNQQSIDEDLIEVKNQQQRTQVSYSNDNQRDGDNIRMEIREMRNDINLIKKHYCTVLMKQNSKEHLKRTQYASLEIIKTKTPSSPQYKLKRKKKKKGDVIKQCFTHNYLSSADLHNTGVIKDLKKEEYSLNDIGTRKTFLTENNNASYNKTNESVYLNSNINSNLDLHHETHDETLLNNENDNDHNQSHNHNHNDHNHADPSKPTKKTKTKSKEKKMTNFSTLTQKHTESLNKETKTRDIPYNRAIRTRIQTQMFCGREKISLLHFEPKKEKISLNLTSKGNIIHSKVKSVDHLKTRMNNNYKANKNQLALSNEAKEYKNQSRISCQPNDKLLIDCSATKTNTEDQRDTILECCFEERKEDNNKD